MIRIGTLALAAALVASATQVMAQGSRVEAGKEAAVVESAKAASEVYAPVSGEVVAVNELIAGDPAKVNADPLGEGWFLSVKLDDQKAFDALMDEAAYAKFVAEQG